MFNRDQKRYILSHLSTIERELTGALAATSAGGDATLFPRYRDSLAANEEVLLAAKLERLRAAMRCFLDAGGIARATEGDVSARWALQTHLALLKNLVIELRPAYMRGYGVLDEDAERACQRLSAELSLLMDDMAEALRPVPIPALPAGATGEWARTIHAVIERYGLSEYRTRFSSLAEAGSEPNVEIAVLGRVSSGKSSLINALIGEALLPVGAVPVTSVTTRLRYGKALAVETVGMDGRHAHPAAGELTALISETGNPGNRLRLAEVRVSLPAAFLNRGVLLADTPGLGSLRASASRHALDYLPRCDLGVLAVDATSTLGQQDMDLTRALLDAGARTMVALTKADLLDEGAREEQLIYATAAMRAALGAEVDVFMISTRADWSSMLSRWTQEHLAPRIRAARGDSHHRRTQQRRQLTREIRRILEQTRDEHSAASPRNLADASLVLQQTEARVNAIINDLGTRTIEAACTASVDAWLKSPSGEVLDRLFADTLASVLDALARESRAAVSKTSAELLADYDFEQHTPPLPAFAGDAWPALQSQAGIWGGRRRQASHQLRPLLDAAAKRATGYRDQLRNWLQVTMEMLRAELRMRAADASAVPDAQQLAEDIRRLELLMPDGPVRLA
jgi:GTP-binding protein EngB required for normal cell division